MWNSQVNARIFLPARRLDERPLPSSNTVPHCRALSRTVPRDVARDARARVDAFVDAMFTSFVLMAVKKGPFARGTSRARTAGFDLDSIARDRWRPTRAPRRASAERDHRLTHRARHARSLARRRDHLEDARVREDVPNAPTQRPGARRRRATLASIARAPPARETRRLTPRASFHGFAEKRQIDPGRGEGSEEGGRARPRVTRRQSLRRAAVAVIVLRPRLALVDHH